jgi:transposase-like protein
MVLMVLEIAGASLDDLACAMVQPSQRTPQMARQVQQALTRQDLPCGNPACRRFLGPLERALSSRTPEENPIQAVCSACSYTYRWDRRMPGGVSLMNPGDLWDQLLTKTLADETCGIRAASRVVQVTPTTVMRHARRLGIWRQEWKDRPKVQVREPSRAERLLERHRQGWLAFRSASTTGPAKQFPKAASNAYRYLIRKDRSWLSQNHPLPPQRGRKQPPPEDA